MYIHMYVHVVVFIKVSVVFPTVNAVTLLQREVISTEFLLVYVYTRDDHFQVLNYLGYTTTRTIPSTPSTIV